MPTIRLDQEAVRLLIKYHWGGNIRQLRNITEQLSVLEQKRELDHEKLKEYLPHVGSNLPAVVQAKKQSSDFSSEREILYKVLFDMQRDLNDLKKLTLELMKTGNASKVKDEQAHLIEQIYAPQNKAASIESLAESNQPNDEGTHDVELIDLSTAQKESQDKYHFAEEIEEEESLSLHDKELELIKKSLEKYDGKRKEAAEELGISERTLSRFGWNRRLQGRGFSQSSDQGWIYRARRDEPSGMPVHRSNNVRSSHKPRRHGRHVGAW